MKLEAPWSLTSEELARQLETDLSTGLTQSVADARLEEHGPNELQGKKGRSPLRVFLDQFLDLMIGLLAAAAVISAVLGDWSDAILIALIVLANALIGFLQEQKAEKAVQALKSLSRPHAKVWRDGKLHDVAASQITVGDLVDLERGGFVPADVRVVEAVELQTDESPLTGESLPVYKVTDTQSADTALPDRHGMAFAGTAVVQGRGRGIVVAIGMKSELGKIATMLESADEVETPLQRRLAKLGKQLAVVVLLCCLVIFVVGVLREGRENWNKELFSQLLLTAVSLAVAAIPEGLPAVISVALALGSQEMTRRKAIVRRLAAVETLGSVNVICSDKTGTLTQNRMTVSEVFPVGAEDSNASDDATRPLLIAGMLCSDVELSSNGEAIGSATEKAIFGAGLQQDLDPRTLRNSWPRLDELPFNSTVKRMTTLHRSPSGQNVAFLKGSVEAVLEHCTHQGHITAHLADNKETPSGSGKPLPLDDSQREEWERRTAELADKGHRVIAVAEAIWESDKLQANGESLAKRFSFLGLVAIVDPVRPEAREAIGRCREAGIRAVMITGDHVGTARAIAQGLDLWQPNSKAITGSQLDAMSDEELASIVGDVAVFARVSPEHKLRIVRAHQSQHSVTSMTGDGVNDAPALKQAEIGVAMGIAGTDVAKEASEMILADDNFATIVSAVEVGRSVYDNIRKFVSYLLTANTSEILVLLFAICVGMPLPLLPTQILWINLVTDGMPALALAFEPAERNIMKKKPRGRNESIFADGLIQDIIIFGLLMAVCSLGVFTAYYYQYVTVAIPEGVEQSTYLLEYARTMTFYVLAMLQLFYVLALRSSTDTLFSLGLLSNIRLAMAVALGIVLQVVVIYFAPLQKYFHTISVSPRDLVLATVVSLAAFVAVELRKVFRGSQKSAKPLPA